jgi:hypothetical protein
MARLRLHLPEPLTLLQHPARRPRISSRCRQIVRQFHRRRKNRRRPKVFPSRSRNRRLNRPRRPLRRNKKQESQKVSSALPIYGTLS